VRAVDFHDFSQFRFFWNPFEDKLGTTTNRFEVLGVGILGWVGRRGEKSRRENEKSRFSADFEG
jgi:hypothetical protein